MLVTADWVLPVDALPIRRGAVRIHNARIAEVGPADAFTQKLGDLPRYDFPGCVVTPGLVNAHTHLSLTALGGLLQPAPFGEWLGRVVPMMRALDENDIAASATLGALKCLQAGVTCVGDIAYGPEAPAAAGDAGVGGVFFWEVLGIPGKGLQRALDAAEFPRTEGEARSGRVRTGISPHAPYSSGPSLLRAESAFARQHGYPLAIHVAESSAEMQLFAEGRGPLRDVSRRLARDLAPGSGTPVAYLERLGVLDGALAVHCVHLHPGEAHTLARVTRGVALCPRSNRFLRNGSPPVEALVLAKATVGIGSDSLASNDSIDLLAEARAVQRLMPALDAPRLLRMLTLEGASALGIDATFGSLTAGKQGDLAVFRVPAGAHPAEALLDERSGASIEAVLSGGIWRVREGRLTVATKALDAEVRRAADKARAADG